MKGFWRRLLNHFVPHADNAYRPHLLRRRSLAALLGIILVVEGILVVNLLARQSGQSFLAAVIQSEIFSLTNSERVANNVGVLTENPLLDQSAQAKADDMAAKGYFAHQSPDGRQPWDFITATGYDYQYAGENLAVRFVDSSDVMNAWMASPTHRANIVKPNYTEVGIGIAQGIYEGQSVTFVVQHFGTPEPASVAKALPPKAPAPAVASAVSTTAPATTTVLGAQAPAPTPVPAPAVASNVTPAPAPTTNEPASFTQSLLRQAGRIFSEPRATTAWILGIIIALLGLALAFTFFHHIQIQAHDLLLPGLAVAGIALMLLVINTQFLSVSSTAGEQPAAAFYSGGGVVLTPTAASDER